MVQPANPQPESNGLSSAIDPGRPAELFHQQANISIERLQNPPGEGQYLAEGRHTLFVSLNPRPLHYLQVQDGRSHAALYRPGDMLITPAGMPLFVRWEGEEDCLQIQISAEWLQAIAMETFARDGAARQLIPEFQTRNPHLEAIASMLSTASGQGALGSQLYLDSLTNVLAVNLLEQHSTARPRLPVYPGGLPTRQLQTILDFVDAHLDRDLRLDQLAQLLDMSQFHFSRMFKQSMGISPYQYLIRQRVERSKQLLKATDRSIVEIALDCGFNSHSHLSKQFKQVTGMTPKAYRAL